MPHMHQNRGADIAVATSAGGVTAPVVKKLGSFQRVDALLDELKTDEKKRRRTKR